MKEVKVVRIVKGQIWQHNDPRPRQVRIISVSALSTGRPYATVENLVSGTLTRVSLDRMRPASHWRLVDSTPAPTQDRAGATEKPVAAEPGV
jgi:hypothetical protein